MQRKMCNSAVEEIGALFFLEVFPYILKKKEICAESGLKNDLENEYWRNEKNDRTGFLNVYTVDHWCPFVSIYVHSLGPVGDLSPNPTAPLAFKNTQKRGFCSLIHMQQVPFGFRQKSLIFTFHLSDYFVAYHWTKVG